MNIRNKILQGDAITVLKTMPGESVDCLITSPPYYSLRLYGTEPIIWDGDEDCGHEWEKAPPRRTRKVTDVVDMDSLQATNKGAQHDLPGTDFCIHCNAWKGELGLEPTPELFIQHLVQIFREARRVLKKHGVMFINIGDSYNAASSNQNSRKEFNSTINTIRYYSNGDNGVGKKKLLKGLKPKDLLMIPASLAIALRDDGWYLRQDLIWAKGVSGQKNIWDNAFNAAIKEGLGREAAKRIADAVDPYVGNCMPESANDRCTKSHEYIFLLTKSAKYYFDAESIKEKAAGYDGRKELNYNGGNKDVSIGKHKRWTAKNLQRDGRGPQSIHINRANSSSDGSYFVRNRRSVWTIPTRPYAGAHFAVFNSDLITPCIKAGTSEKGVCSKCGMPWVRVVNSGSRKPEDIKGKWGDDRHGKNILLGPVNITTTTGWEPTCECNAETVPAIVLDPFAGAGTTLVTAKRLGRDYCGIEIKKEYINEHIRPRLENCMPLFTEETI